MTSHMHRIPFQLKIARNYRATESRQNLVAWLLRAATLSLVLWTIVFLGVGPVHGQTTLATIITPANGATNVDPGAAFVWNQVSDAQGYYIWIGTQHNQSDVWSSGAINLNLNSVAPPAGVLHVNTTYFLRMWTEINGIYTNHFVDTSFTTASSTNSPARLSSPANGATNVDPFLPFAWNAVSGAQSYTLNIGSTPGGSNIFQGSPTTATSITVPGLQPNTTYYTTLITQFSSGPLSTTTSFTTGTGAAHLITPANGATNVNPGAPITWNAVSGAQAYTLYLGSSVGAKNFYYSGETLVTSVTVSTLPANTLCFARMWTKRNNTWSSFDTTFTTGSGSVISHLTYPTNGATNIDPWNPFTWTAPSGATSYGLTVGTSPGGSDVYVSPALTTTSLTVPGLKQNTAYFVQLSTTSASGTSSVSTSFTTGLGMAHLISPANGATNVDPYQPFTWNSVPGAAFYYIYVGTAPGVVDVYNSGQMPSTSRVATGLFGGKTYYVTLYTFINSTWYSIASSFSTAPQPLPPDAAAFRTTVQQQTGNVRLMTVGASNTPTPGTPLAQVAAEDGVTSVFCTEYARTLAQQLAGQRITARVRSTSLDGTQYESHVSTEYWDPFLLQWITADATFGVVYWNNSASSGMSMDSMSSAVAAQNWSSIQPFILYTTSNGNLYSHNYYMDPILLYLNPLQEGNFIVKLPLANSPTPYFTVHTTADVGKAGNWLFAFVNQTDTVTILNPVNKTLVFSPQRGTIYSGSVNLNNGWSITSAPSGLQILSMNRYLYF